MILVAATDAALRDLVLRAVARHVASSQLVFAEVIATKALPAGSGTVVSRNEFAAAELCHELAITWRSGPHAYGYRADDLGAAAESRTVVLGIDSAQANAALDAWPRARLIHLHTRLDRLRAAAAMREPHPKIIHDALNIGATIRAIGRAISEYACSNEHAFRPPPQTALPGRRPAHRRPRRGTTPQPASELTA